MFEFLAAWLALSLIPGIALGKFLKSQHRPIKRLAQWEADRFDHRRPAPRFNLAHVQTNTPKD
jgi:hypothetical protein